MDLPGHEFPDLGSSVFKGSAEDFDRKCDPCLSEGQHLDAQGFCVDCQEYLCKSCLKFHQRTRALNHHQLLDKDKMEDYNKSPRKPSQECAEKCITHANGVIKFFCTKHKALGCNDCITMDHRSCKVDYIPHNCADIGESMEYHRATWLIDLKIKEIDRVMKKATVRDKEIDTCHDSLIQDIVKFRKEINDFLDKLHKEIQEKVAKKKSEDKQVIQKVKQICSVVSADINKLQTSINTYNDSKQEGQLYINIKQAESKLKSDEVRKAEETLSKTNMQYKFEHSKELVNVLSKQNIFGKLTLSDQLQVPRKKTLDMLTLKEAITVRTKSDKPSCDITGCEVLSSDKLVLADNNNKKLKVLDIQSKTVTQEETFDSKPRDIAVLPHDQIAVTMPYNGEVVIMTTASHLSVLHKIPFKGICYCITYHQGYLYVVCQKPNSVHVLDTQGNVKNTISLNNDIFKNPLYIVVSEDTRLIYISDSDSKSVVSITLQGDVSAVYKHKDLSGPRGMLMLDDGSLLVCCWWNNTIHHISRDLKQGQTMIDSLPIPHSICYSHHHDEVYIGCYNDQLKVCSIKLTD